MLVIRLQRVGKKHQPAYRVVVAEKRSKLSGPPVEDLGSYNSFTKALSVNKDRVNYWLKTGCQPTPTVHNFLVKSGILDGRKIAIKVRKGEVRGTEAPPSLVAETKAETKTST